MNQGSCKKCSRHLPVALLFGCSFICMILSAIVIGKYFTTEPSTNEIFVGSVITIILVISIIGSIIGTIYLLLVCLQKYKKRKRDANLTNDGIVRNMNRELEIEDAISDFEL